MGRKMGISSSLKKDVKQSLMEMVGKWQWILTILLSCYLLSPNVMASSAADENPYEILQVSRMASSKEIRRVYKNLAIIWHPDKKNSPEAEEQFIKINKAYELLSDPARRRLYDQRGITEESPNFDPKPDYTSFNRFDPIDEILTFTTGGAFHYPFADGIAFLHKQSITSKTFEQTTVPKSFSEPQLILFYGDWCSSCARVAPIWRSISDQLTNIGMEVQCVHAERETTIAKKIGIKVIPSVVLLLDSHPYHYRETDIAANKIIAFIRSKLPYDLLVPLDKENIDDFLGSWWDNRIRVIIVGTSDSIRLRYLVLAFQFRERAAFGYVTTEEKDFHLFKQRFGVPETSDSILVFKELGKPVASMSMTEIPQKLMSDLIENNKFLILPRLSSQAVMDIICPTESSVYRRRLCVVFLTRQTKVLEDEEHIKALREYAMRQSSSSRVKFAYLYGDKQRDFISSLSGHQDSNLIIIWRQTSSKMSYEWIEGGWDGMNTSILRLDSILHRLLSEKLTLTHQVEVKELTDEHAQGFLFKVLKKVSMTMEFFRQQVTREMVIQTGSVIVTVLFIVAGGFIMAYLVRLEEESILAKAKANAQRTSPSSSSRASQPTSTSENAPSPLQLLIQNPECRIHEMRGETFNGLVRLIKPGCRTLLLLLDADTKEILLRKFQRCVWPYRKNKSLQFGFMHVDRLGGLSWYKQVLQLSLSEPKTLNINPRNCVGTVISLNGHRKYFCVFHATMHISGSRRRASSGYRNGAFLGLDSENSSDEQSDVERGTALCNDVSENTDGAEILFTNHLLDNLSNWLDRLFEGSTLRYHINYWPDFPLK